MTPEDKDIKKLDLISITYIKCKPEEITKFQEEFNKSWFKKPLQKIAYISNESRWSFDDKSDHTIMPVLFGTSIGHFDFIIISLASSASVVAQFCMEFLRGEKKNPNNKEDRFEAIEPLGKKISDTQSTIAVNAVGKTFIKELGIIQKVI